MAIGRPETLLRRHLRRALEPEEALMAADALAFIAAHPDCLWRTCLAGHLTGSAWIVDSARARALLLHHGKLDRWLQPGGHADGEDDLSAVARREAQEETGLSGLRLATPELFDFDRHRIPERGSEPAHWHYDFRFQFEADPAEPLLVSAKSRALRWFALEEIAAVAPGASVARLVRKTR